MFGAVATIGLALPMVLAQPSGSEPGGREGILLLRNGNLLRGQITQTDAGYDVVVDGGEIHLRSSDVEFCCQTLEEGYQRKRALVRPGDVRGHLDLADWCQRHGLLGSAARELAEARRLQPGHPLIPLIERRIKTALFEPERIDGPAQPVEAIPSPDQLDLLVRGMPPHSVEKFTQIVQPLLADHCSTAGCHGPQSESGFRLFRIPSGRPPNRRLTQRNLHSTLEWIDRANPAASPILTAPLRPHGSAETAIFTDRQVDQYQQLVEWVYLVAQKPEPVTTVPHKEPASLPRQDRLPWAEKPPWLAMPADQAAPDGRAGDGFADPAADPFGPEPFAPLVPHDRQRVIPPVGSWPSIPSGADDSGGTGPQFVPADPFDPEIFNRRFFAQIR